MKRETRQGRLVIPATSPGDDALCDALQRFWVLGRQGGNAEKWNID